MTKSIFSFLLFFSFIVFVNAQPQKKETKNPEISVLKEITITGKVLDKETKEPLEYATIAFFSKEENKIVTGGITDANGAFNLTIKSGVYDITIEYIAFKTQTIPNKNLTKSEDIGLFLLEIDTESLDEVEIIAERTTVEIKLDKKIYNIGSDLTTSGATVSDALNNVPSVTVDIDGAISLRGNSNVRILINGKPSALAGFGSTDALQQLPADAIEKVEVITSPSARYDAEGTAGILNIVLKKEKTLGINGSANVSLGSPTDNRITTNFNIRTDNFNIFNTLGYFNRQPPGNGYFDNVYSSGTYSRIIEDRDINRNDEGFNINIGMEYYLTEKSSITGSFFTRLADEQDITSNNSQRFIENTLDSRTLRREEQNEDDKSYQISLNYTNNFDDEGHKLTADFQYSYDDETVGTTIEENNTFPNEALLALENIAEDQVQNDYLAQIDYVLPIGNAQFEAGYRGTFDREENTYKLDTLNIETGEFFTNINLNNTFNFEQNVNAFYTQYGDKLGKFSFLLGLRLENTQLKGSVESELDEASFEEELDIPFDTNFDKNYLGLFPTVNLIYEITEDENISLGYNRRINRPRSWFINPFPSRSSRTNIFQGNPDLDPAFSNAFDLGYLKRWEKLTLSSSIYYQKETNAFERVQEETGSTTLEGIQIIRSIPINLSTNERYGFETSLMYNPSRKMRFNGSFNLFKFVNDGFFNDVDYSVENTSWFARFSSKITLPAKIEWQTNAFYRGPRENAQTKTDGIFSLDLAFSKDLFKDKATLSFNVRDLLNSRKRKSFTETEFFTSDSEFQWRERQFNISLMYRFNQPKDRRNGRGRNNGDDFEGGEF